MAVCLPFLDLLLVFYPALPFAGGSLDTYDVCSCPGAKATPPARETWYAGMTPS